MLRCPLAAEALAEAQATRSRVRNRLYITGSGSGTECLITVNSDFVFWLTRSEYALMIQCDDYD